MTSMISSIVGRIRSFSLSQENASSPPVTTSPAQFNVARLPAEIRLSLLKAADNLFTLRCLATSSAAFLLVYNENRQTVLDAVMGRSMDLSLVPESAFASATSRIDFEAADVATQIGRFLRKYHERKESPTPGRITGLFNKVQQAQHMKRLYSIVDGLCADFCRRASEYIGISSDLISYESLSKSERHRLNRAFFRYELFSNLYRDQGVCLDFKARKYAPGLLSYNKNFVYRDDYDETAVDDENMAKDFLLPFTPQDVEEFASIHDYSMRRWSEVMAEHESYSMTTNVNQDNSQDPLRDLTPSRWGYEGYRRHFSVLGLGFLYTFLKPHTSIEERQTLLRCNLYYGTCDPSSVVDDYRYRLTHKFEASNQERDNGIQDENDSTRLNRLLNPAWELWNTEFAQSMVADGHDNEMRQSGFIFWDEDRVRSLAQMVRTSHAESAASATGNEIGV